MTERLYGTGDMARALGIGANTFANRRNRTGPRAYNPPEPAYVHGRNNMPLWTRAQMETVIADRQARALAVLEGDA